jgi:hypothetical protein
MEKLNSTIEKATMSKLSPVTSVNRKFLYSLCAALFLLTCSLSTKAQRYYIGTQADPDTLTFGYDYTQYQNHKQTSACTSCSPLTDAYEPNPANPGHSGTDKWIEITLKDDGYLTIHGGTSDFDSVFYLFDSSMNPITSGDDGDGSGDNNGHNFLQPVIQYYASAGTYYLIVDGTDKYGWATSGSVGIDITLTHF